MSILNLAFNHTSLNLKNTEDLKTSAQGKHAAVEAEKDDDGAAADVGGYCDKRGAPPSHRANTFGRSRSTAASNE